MKISEVCEGMLTEITVDNFALCSFSYNLPLLLFNSPPPPTSRLQILFSPNASTKHEPLIAVEPRGPPTTNEGTETSFRLDHCRHFQKSKLLLRSEVGWCDQTRLDIEVHRAICLAERISSQKEPLRRSQFTAALNLHMLDVGRSPNADSPTRDHLITMVKLKKKT